MKDFSYYKPSTVSEAVALLAGNGDSRPLSGGMTLLPTMKMRLASPTAIVDLAALPGLTAITVSGGSVTIGAMPCSTHCRSGSSASEAMGLLPGPRGSWSPWTVYGPAPPPQCPIPRNRNSRANSFHTKQ